MHKIWALAALIPLTLGSCERQSANAEREAEIVERAGDQDAICQARRKVAAAYLNEKNEDEYRIKNAAAESYCLNAQLEKRLDVGVPEGDNLTAVD